MNPKNDNFEYPKIDLNLLSVNYDFFWQNIVKELYHIEEYINLNKEIVNIRFENPSSSYTYFFN